MAEQNQAKIGVLVAPKNFVSDPEGFFLVHLRQPRNGEQALFAFRHSDESHEVKEIITLTHEYGAWFIGDTIESDGSLQLATSVDPLLLVLPYLRQAKRPVPLDHLLVEEGSDCPSLIDHLRPCLTPKRLQKVANSKGSADLNVWAYDEAKTLEYLSKKVERLSAELTRQRGEDTTSGDNNDNDRHTAWSILSDYLEPEMSVSLAKHLGIKEEPLNKKQHPNVSNGDVRSASKSVAVDPEEDYTEAPKAKAAKLSASSARQKALAKSAAGSKNIMAFFAKK